MASSPADSNVRPHDRFFFSDGSLYLLVENSLYCVHRFLFEIHASMFPVRELETSLINPYVLGDVKQIDFDRLLASLYPRTLWVEETETTQDWISVLGLASKWGFESLRSRAISKIEQTLDSPIDMVTLGRQYGIPAFLLPGYAVLCQSTVPLSDEEGLRLGVEDVLKIYRIRHELYGSGITPVPLEVAFAEVKEAGLGDEQSREELEGEQASTWTDVGSVATSQTSAENEADRGSVTLTPNVDSPPLDVASTDAATLVSERPEQRNVDAHSPRDESTPVALGNVGGSDVPSSVLPGNVSDLNSGSLESAREGINLVKELTHDNFDLVSVEIMQWVNTKDIQMLHQITRLIVEKAIEATNASNDSTHPYVRLCKTMVKYTQTRHQIARLIVEKAMAMEDPRYYACAQLCKMMIDTNGNTIAGGSLFSEYLGEICQENLEAIAASVAAAGDHTARIRRLRLIDFIEMLWSVGTPVDTEKWMTTLLDADDEEKVATLCMLMTRAGWACDTFNMNGWFQRVKNIAQETSKPRVRKLLEDVTKGGRVKWVIAEPSEDCTVQ
ncbi:hypothetical protein M378DRAFT_168063 [Amanita muscaria Koide BX008]|uniref:Uncharacterized protein n=1 Tax=Amanita muscaria (strain Koide BX008) TaxID=946122 RepID=A0A0C2WG98_AMAMK|nr:hypothetical protein M378DRAFT_168063 [Amanita muscaria Koide BX008]